MPTLAKNPSVDLPTSNNGIELNEVNNNNNNIVDSSALNSSESPILIVKKILPYHHQSLQQQQQRQEEDNNNFQDSSSINNCTKSFQVLNSVDNFQPINKPNAIVHPVRRSNNTVTDIATTDSIIKLQNDNSSSSLSLSDNKKTKKNSNIFNYFAKELDSRLKRLKNDKSPLSKNNNTQDPIINRPLFVTTVPKGVFLQPVKEIPVIPSKRIYAFSSRPRIIQHVCAGDDRKRFHENTSNNNNNNNNNINQMNDNKVNKEIVSAINGIRNFTNTLTTTTTSITSSSIRKPRDTQQHQSYKNLMHDKRIIRGSNYNQSQFIPGDTDYSATKESERRRHLIKKRQVQTRNLRNVIGTPPPVFGRKHEDVQTEKYLEELYERPPVHEASAQTELFLERPPTPPYVPAKTGVDAQTEILEGELFDFDTEVQPIVETIVGHTIEQSLLEVIHEEEISDLKKQQQEFLAQREAELSELRRLEAEELRLQAEKERRIRQDEIAKQIDAEVQERVTAAKLLQGYIANILPGVLSHIEPLIEAADRTNLEKELCPWLTKEVAEEVGHIIDSREILTEIIKEILVERASKYLDIVEELEEDEKEEDVAFEEENTFETVSISTGNVETTKAEEYVKTPETAEISDNPQIIQQDEENIKTSETLKGEDNEQHNGSVKSSKATEISKIFEADQHQNENEKSPSQTMEISKTPEAVKIDIIGDTVATKNTETIEKINDGEINDVPTKRNDAEIIGDTKSLKSENAEDVENNISGTDEPKNVVSLDESDNENDP